MVIKRLTREIVVHTSNYKNFNTIKNFFLKVLFQIKQKSTLSKSNATDIT